jgi:ABC-type anion transport system duplicated permease subunit
MERLSSALTARDWIALGLIALILVLMVLGILVIRRELRMDARAQARSVKLKTTEHQRRSWRQETRSQEVIDLLDDIDLLLTKLGRDGPPATRQEHQEAVRLSWKSRHVPFGTLLIGILILACLLSAILTIVAEGPANPIP